jgi:hypothetical protein
MFNTLRKYIVKIGYDGKHSGSGVIINNNSNDSFYIFTAKHLFFDKNMKIKDMKVNDMKVNDITKKINISSPSFTIDDNVKLEPFEINNEYDFLIIKVSQYNIEENLPINIFMDDMDNKTNLSIMGFPHIRDDESTDYDSYPCTYKHKCNNIKNFEIDSDRILTVRAKEGNANYEISGLSGSGVYLTTENKEISIVGILIESATGQGIVCFDLRTIIDEIHEKIDIVISRKNEILIEAKEKNINTKNNFEKEKKSIEKKVKDKLPHIIYRDGYIEPRTVYIEELDIHVAVCPVTFEEYDLFCEDRGMIHPKPYKYKFPRENYPIINIKWDDAIEYCAWLSSKVDTFKYKLPSSKEWDTIAKLNSINIDKIDDYIWHKGNDTTIIKRVGTKKSGKLGIFDLFGNINEWCDDNYDKKNKIIKGESFNHFFENLDTELNYYLQNESKKLLGFRIIANKIS